MKIMITNTKFLQHDNLKFGDRPTGKHPYVILLSNVAIVITRSKYQMIVNILSFPKFFSVSFIPFYNLNSMFFSPLCH